jgi:hypothetical protein
LHVFCAHPTTMTREDSGIQTGAENRSRCASALRDQKRDLLWKRQKPPTALASPLNLSLYGSWEDGCIKPVQTCCAKALECWGVAENSRNWRSKTRLSHWDSFPGKTAPQQQLRVQTSYDIYILASYEISARIYTEHNSYPWSACPLRNYLFTCTFHTARPHR